MSKLDLSKVRGFKYAPKTGNVYQSIKGTNRRFSGVKQTKDSHGYIQASYKNINFRVHRLVFYLMGVEIPKDKVVDHINENKSDNRWCNLRLVSVRENLLNQKKNRDRKLAGVKKCRYGFQAVKKFSSKTYNIGAFKTELEAHKAYMNSPDNLDEFLEYRKQFYQGKGWRKNRQ